MLDSGKKERERVREREREKEGGREGWKEREREREKRGGGRGRNPARMRIVMGQAGTQSSDPLFSSPARYRQSYRGSAQRRK